MNPDEVKAQMDFQARQTAIQLAHQRAKTGASTQDVIADAELIMQFMQAGASVATPEEDNGGQG
jgi:hypothetical protein